MIRSLFLLFLLASAAMVASPSMAKKPTAPAASTVKANPGQGEVRVPLNQYQNMIEQLRQTPERAPARYALGQNRLRVNISRQNHHATAAIEAVFSIKTFEDQWTLIPVLPAGVALDQASVDGEPVQLVLGPHGYAWSTDQSGVVKMTVKYRADAFSEQKGFAMAVPVPLNTAGRLTVRYDGASVDMAVIPATSVKVSKNSRGTSLTATLPATSGIMIHWRAASDQTYTISHGSYRGELKEKAAVFNAAFSLHVLSGDEQKIPLFPTAMTLGRVKLDGKAAVIVVEDKMFNILVKGKGKHRIDVDFHAPVMVDQSNPAVEFFMPRVPTASLAMKLPGKKEIQISPLTHVEHKYEKAGTLIHANLPMQDRLRISWVESVPSLLQKVQANAVLYQLHHAEEGVLHTQTVAEFSITHGKTHKLAFRVPRDIQFNKIESASHRVSDWTENNPENPENKHHKIVEVYLEKAVNGRVVLDLFYERLYTPEQGKSGLEIPMIQALQVRRQRGAIALLTGTELGLKPGQTEYLNKVGENQLPAFVRKRLRMQVAHTYKYTQPRAALSVLATAPERKQGKFDATVDTLISVGEVNLKLASTVQIDVKSGTLMQLNLSLPREINLLSVSAPSMRDYKVLQQDKNQLIHINFTQDMEGHFAVNLKYEKIMQEGDGGILVPRLGVEHADVEHGRLAVEAQSVVQIHAEQVQQLSTVDIGELPKQLLIKTSNPILLAYKYLYADPPYQLGLKITRHEEMEVKTAAIEQARYHTLVTRDGLAVTTAKLFVKNARKQFLKLEIPARSEIWSVTVADKAEKPARAKTGGNTYLLKLINSSAGFTVEVIYATRIDRMKSMGSLNTHLPKPDIIVTRSRWDMYLPEGPRYLQPNTRLDRVLNGAPADNNIHTAAVMEARLPLHVPKKGVHFAFEKLYANQGPDHAWVRIPYTTGASYLLGFIVALLGSAGFVFAMIRLAGRGANRDKKLLAASAVVGMAMIVLAVLVFHLSLLSLMTGFSAMTLTVIAVEYVRTRRQSAHPTLPS